ncbi:MAG: hypothetical protein A2040_17345 [Rhodocyclales bacterium GWA2_65_19]|nr:MAG: hypothetical protein A2040_17345 [Rhodocyclales bacterium GWA2_65_19]
MEKLSLTERDICTKYITPAIFAGGWSQLQFREEVKLMRSKGELAAKAVWQASGLEIDEFYRQLKTEMAHGWIVQPEVAYVRDVTAD